MRLSGGRDGNRNCFLFSIMLKWLIVEVKMLGSLRLVKLSVLRAFLKLKSLENTRFLKVLFGHEKLPLSRAFSSQEDHFCGAVSSA